MGRFTISIAIKTDKSIHISDKEIAYFKRGNGKICRDTIKFTQNKITISGSRREDIDFDNGFYTIRSNFYKHTVKALLYLHLLVGSFELQKITFGKVDIALSEDVKQKFNCDFDCHINKDVLEKLFEYGKESDELTKVLVLLFESQHANREQFHYLWRGFNTIYNFKSGNQIDSDSINKMLNHIAENPKKYTDSIALSEEFIAQYDEKQYTRFLKIANDRTDYSERKWLSDMGRFSTKYIEVGYVDARVNELISQIWEDSFVKNKEKFYSDKASRKKFESCTKKIKSLEKETCSSDCLKYMIWYIYYFRNKHFHGVEWLNNFLLKNDVDKELANFSNLLYTLLQELINDIF